MIDLNDMYYFVQIVNNRSITGASRVLGIPKSTVSYRMHQLEYSLGVKLINRTTRQFAVTDVGEEFYRHARVMLLNAQAAESAVRQRLTIPTGIVRLSAAVATAQYAMSMLLPGFSIRHPHVRVSQRISDSATDIVADGFDLAVRAHTLPLQDSSLIQRPLAFTPWMLFCSPSLCDARVISHPDELLPLPKLFMVRNGVTQQWNLSHKSGDIVTVPVVPVLMTDCMATLKRAAVGGLGVVALPGYVCKPELQSGELMRLLPDWTAEAASLTALLPYGQNQLPSVRALLDYLVKEIPAVVSME
jgi:DNA-binding transcriptional LysR family regulator